MSNFPVAPSVATPLPPLTGLLSAPDARALLEQLSISISAQRLLDFSALIAPGVTHLGADFVPDHDDPGFRPKLQAVYFTAQGRAYTCGGDKLLPGEIRAQDGRPVDAALSDTDPAELFPCGPAELAALPQCPEGQGELRVCVRDLQRLANLSVPRLAILPAGLRPVSQDEFPALAETVQNAVNARTLLDFARRVLPDVREIKFDWINEYDDENAHFESLSDLTLRGERASLTASYEGFRNEQGEEVQTPAGDFDDISEVFPLSVSVLQDLVRVSEPQTTDPCCLQVVALERLSQQLPALYISDPTSA